MFNFCNLVSSLAYILFKQILQYTVPYVMVISHLWKRIRWISHCGTPQLLRADNCNGEHCGRPNYRRSIRRRQRSKSEIFLPLFETFVCVYSDCAEGVGGWGAVSFNCSSGAQHYKPHVCSQASALTEAWYQQTAINNPYYTRDKYAFPHSLDSAKQIDR